MNHRKASAGFGLFALFLLAPFALSRAQDAPAPAPPLSNESLSLQGFAAQNPLCDEWSDACVVCKRDEKDTPRCSTPGIACQPGPIVCRREKAR